MGGCERMRGDGKVEGWEGVNHNDGNEQQYVHQMTLLMVP